MTNTIVLPSSITAEIEKRARKEGMSIEEYLIDLVLRDLNPNEKAEKYLDGAFELIKQAWKEIEKKDFRQASEKIWGACALAIKAHAYAKTGRRLASHRELHEYKDEIVKEIGDWTLNAWFAANTMHINFYEEWATEDEIKAALKKVEELIKAIAKSICERSKYV